MTNQSFQSRDYQPPVHHANTARSQRRSRRALVPLLILVALTLAMGMVFFADRTNVALAADPSTALYVVGSGGMTTGDCKRVPIVTPTPGNDYSTACTLEYALEQAEDGDELYLQTDFYDTSIVITKSITLRGGFPVGFATGTADPVSNPTSNPTIFRTTTISPVITIEGPITTTLTTSVVLDGLQLTHMGAQDRGIALIGPVTPTLSGLSIDLSISNSIIKENTAASGNGGGLFVDDRIIAALDIFSTTFQTNLAPAGGAIYLPSGSTLVGENVTFTSNEATGGNGGAIYASNGTTVTLTSGTQNTNKATGNGGALYAISSTVTINSGTFNANESTAANGGALYLNRGTATLASAVSLTNNKAALSGGGIYRTNGDLSLTLNNITANTATAGNGGGIVKSGSGMVTLDRVGFLSNKATAGNGGGAYLDAPQVTLTSNTLYTNTALLGGGLYVSGTVSGSLITNKIEGNKANSNGGGLYFNNATLTLDGLTLSRNTATANGGGLYANQSALTSSGPVTFTLNTATSGSGGGAYLAASSGLTATVTTFTSNTAQTNGGGLFADQSRFTALTSTTAVSNTATAGTGGVLYFNASQAALSTTIFTGNKAASGGALGAAGGSTITGTTLNAQRNKATSGIGGVIATQNTAITWSSTATIISNTASSNGGGVYLSGGGMQVSGTATVISNSVTTGNGGGLYLTAGAGYTVTGLLTLQENIAKTDGGGIYVDTGALSFPGGGTVTKNVATTGNGGGFNFANTTTATFGAFTFQSNRAQVNGGALRAQASTLTFTAPTSIISNTATTGNGGGFHLAVGFSTTFDQKLTLDGNTALVSGGGIYATDTALSFGNDSEITDNVATTGSGGGIYLDNGTLTTIKISFLRNTAYVDGGGLYGANGSLALANASVVQLNEAETGNGGGIYAGGGAVTLDAVLIEQNIAQVNGGGLYITGNPALTTLLVGNGSIIRQNSSSTAQGGGIYATSGEITINASTVQSNQAQTGGGGVYQTGGTLTVTNTASIASNTTSTGAGGGLAMITGTVIIDNSALTSNIAETDGGGLYATGSQVLVYTSTVSSNSLTLDLSDVDIDVHSLDKGRGGGIYADGTFFFAIGATFTNNIAKMGGGALYAATLNAQVERTTFTGNDGGRGNGGATRVIADLASLRENTFTANTTAGDGGAIAIEDTAASTIISNTVTENIVKKVEIEKSSEIVDPVVVSGRTLVEPGVYSAVESTEAVGGGIYFERSSGEFTGNFFLRNENRTGEGGGLYLSSSTISMTNNVVAQNSIALSTTYASGIYIINTTLAMRHNTVAENVNKSPVAGANNVAVYITKSQEEASAVEMTNNIIAFHQTGALLLTGNTSSLANNLFFNTDEDWGGTVDYEPSSGNVIGDPLFVDPDNDNYDILRESAAFDIGVATDVTRDIRGVMRPTAFGVDAGAYEQRYLQGVHLRASATPQFVGNGEQITYQIEVVNHSPVAISGVNLNISLPSQQSGSASGPGCSGTSCNFGTMSPGQLNTVNLVATASGTPPDQGFIEMNTTVNVSIGGAGPSDSTEILQTRLQRCRIRYSNVDYISFQAAMAAVNTLDDAPDIIKVAGYCGGNFDITKKLTIQGGWNFNMTTLNPTLFPTTIDGGGSNRVIRILGDIAPTVENVTLRGGSASGKGGGPSGKDAGGIMYIVAARATISNVRMIGGRAAFGAGLYVAPLSAPIIKNSIIENGQAGERGGGVYADNSSPELTNVTIQNNTAKAGGGVYLYKSEAKIVGCTISDNRATGSGSYLEVAGFNVRFAVGGGGGVNFDESKAAISASTLERNTAKAGGAIFADNSPGSISSSLINDNEANGSSTIIPVIVLANKPGGGGAIYAQRADMVVEHNRITNNRATSDAGGAIHIFNGSADAKINGNYFGHNSASKGSVVYVHLKPDVFQIFVLPLTLPPFIIPAILGLPQPDPPKLTMINNTIAHNSGGSVVHFFGNSAGELVGNIFANNSGTGVQASTETMPYLALIPVPIIFVIPIPFPVFHVPSVQMDYTLWYPGGVSKSTSGVGASVNTSNDITGKDPAFKDDGYHIKRISFAYNAGKNTGIPVDVDGEMRPQADITDLGADEYPALGVRYVAPGGGDTGGERCANFLNPCGTLQTAIDFASEGDLIKMAGGTYTAKATRAGQVQLGYITKTLTIQGGYYRFTTDNNVTEGIYTDNDWEVPFPDLNPTILDAGNNGRAFFVVDEKRLDEEGNEIKVEPILSGLRIKNGNSNGLKGPQGNQFDAGGAIYLDNTKITIRDVEITDSTADYGGAVYALSTTLIMSDVLVKNNTANDRGGGFYLETSNDAIIDGIVVETNTAPRGGGFYLEGSSSNIRLNQISANVAITAGGGIYLDNSPANIISNTITANIAANGAGFYAEESGAVLTGNTVTNNKALNATTGNGRGGGCFVGAGSTNVNNNLFEGNQAILGAGCFLNDSSANIRTNEFLANIATNSGGGLYLRNSSGASIQENTIDSNRANSTAADNGGGGLFVESSNSTIRLNTVTNNIANAGGALYLFSFSNANVQENILNTNTATQDGGGLYIKLSDPQLNKNTIKFNKTSQGNGGGVYIRLSNAQLVENIIEENVAILGGGGVYLDQSGASLEKDSIRDNTAKDGAGIYIFRSDTAKFDTVAIELNRATQFGGGVYIRLSSVPLEDHAINDNFAAVAGGGVYMDESAVSFNRNTIRNNEAGQQGGGIAITRRSLATLGSNAVVDNRAGNTGSGIYIAGSQPKLIHTTIARNVGGDGTGVVAVGGDGAPSSVSMVNTILASQSLAVRASTGSTITLSATLWDNNGQKWSVGAGKIFTGSLELNFDGPARFQADGIHIQKNSKAIGVGLESEVGRDIDGDGRPQGSGPELGADELLADCAAVIYRGTSILPITYTKVQDALSNTQPADEVRISGTCIGGVVTSGTRQLGYINKQITVRGGYTPTNWLLSYPITQPTFLDAQGEGRVFFIASGTNATIQDLNLAGGDASNQGGGPSGLDAGGLIYVRNANPTLKNLTMTGGSAYYGGALYLENSTSTLTDSKLDNNKATKGGGIFLRNAPATLRDNSLEGNTATDGAGIFLSFSAATLTKNALSLNAATGAGGGIFLESSSAKLTENGIFTNTAQTAGGVYVDGASPTITRNTINANVGQNGGGIYLATTTAAINGNQFIANGGGIGAGIYVQAGNPTLDNNVIAKNTGEIQAAAIYVLSSSPKLRHNTIAANVGGDGSALFITDLGVEPATIEMVNNIIADHTTAITLTAGNKVILRNNLWNNNAKDWAGNGIVDDQGGHVRADPLFTNVDTNDYHLQPASPARDTGASNAGVAIDYDNQTRPADNGFDIGADEFVFTGIQVFIQTVPDPVVAGAPFQLVVRVVNIGNIDQDAKITVTLPAEMTPSGVLTFDALIRRAETWVKTIDATVNASFSGNLTIKAEVTTSADTNETIEASISVAKPDFAITLVAEASPSPVPAGAELLYQIRVNNVGNQPLNATVNATFPDMVSAAASLTFNPNVLGPSGAWTKSIRTSVDPDAEGNLVAVFHATTLEGPTASYTLTVPIAEPSLLTSVTASPSPVLAGQTVTYTLRVTNSGNVDFTNTITFVAPVNENGRPLIAPGADQIFADVVIPAGETWTKVIVGVVQPGYVGALDSQVIVDTQTGLVTVHDDMRQVVLPTRGPTIVAVRDGPWDDPNTWEPARVPNASDIALVQEGVVVDVAGEPNPIVMTGLINEGTILLNCVVGVDMLLQITDFIENPGLIRGRDGQAVGEPGCGITVETNELINPGVIRAGDGQDGAVVPPNGDIINGGDGGAMNVFAQSVLNDGTIRAGDGGDLLAPATSGKGGDGGDVLVAAGPPVPGYLLNSGLIEAGDGGAGPGRPLGDGRGGNGGGATVFSTDLYINDGGAVNAGKGGDGNGDGQGGGPDDGDDGGLSVTSAFIWDNGTMIANGTDYAFGTVARPVVRGVAGATVLVPVMFLNTGLRSDIYVLIWSNSQGWEQVFLPDTTARINGLRYSLLFAPFTIPVGTPGGTESQVSLTARSQNAPNLVQEEFIRVLVVDGGRLWLPRLSQNLFSGTVDNPESPQAGSHTYMLPKIDK